MQPKEAFLTPEIGGTVSENRFALKRSSQYYFQLQLQMFVSELSLNILVVWTKQGVFTIESGFMTKVCSKLEMDESSSRFRIPKSSNEEKASIINSVPKSTVYKNKWAIQIFREWQGQRANKICTIEPGGVFKGEDIGLDVQELTESIENMNAKSLNYWLCKFVQEVANKSGGRYPSRTLYNIVCGLKRFLVEKNGEGALNPLAVSDKRYR